MTTNEPTPLTAEEAVERALLHTFQLSDKDYRKMQRALSEVVFIRTLEQDGYTVAALDAARAQREPELTVERLAWALLDRQYDYVETTEGLVSALDYPEEWFDTPRNIAAAILAALAQPAPDGTTEGSEP